MQPLYVAQSSTASSNWRLMNSMVTPMNIGVAMLITGNATGSIEYTFEDPGGVGGPYTNPTTSTPTAFTLIAAAAANATGSIAFPISAVRVTKTAGTGTVTGVFVQAGIAGP